MEIKDFIGKIEEEFEELETGKLQPGSKFRDFFDWNSINALIFIALVDAEYDVTINADDIRNSETVEDLFAVVQKKSS